MKKNIYILFILALLFSFCEIQTSAENSAVQQIVNAADTDGGDALVKTEYKTNTGKMITVAESHPVGQSISNISIYFSGKPETEIKFTDVDPINKVLVGDLDANGFSELYIITLNAGSGSYGNVIGIASNSDKSLSIITVPTVEENDLKKGGQFEGYEGHDEFEIIENSLARRFPIKSANATHRGINYKLKAGEASYILYIKNSTAY